MTVFPGAFFVAFLVAFFGESGEWRCISMYTSTSREQDDSSDSSEIRTRFCVIVEANKMFNDLSTRRLSTSIELQASVYEAFRSTQPI